jgi:predicted nucleic acid-binding protein
MIASCKKIKVRSTFKVIQDDHDDDIVINTAIDGKADYIVSGDSHLLSLGRFKGIRIMTVEDMLNELEHYP